MLRCPQGIRLWHSETRQENAFTQRLIFVAKDTDCASCPARTACLGRTASGKPGRRVSAVRHRRITEVIVHPRPATAEAAIRWKDVAGRQLRRSWMAHWRQQTVTLAALPASLSPPPRPPRAARSHWRLSWPERLTTQCACSAPGDEYPGDGSCREGPRSPPASLVRRADCPHSFPRCFFAWAQSPYTV